MKNNIIQSLDRGLKILQILGRSSRAMSLNDIARDFEIDRSSVYRLISTLVKNNFVKQEPETKKYRIGFKVLELAGTFNEQTHIDSVLRPIMNRIREETRQNTHLAILDGDEVVFIAVDQPREHISVNIQVGTREPVAPTALGKALISFQQEKVLDDFMANISLQKYTDNSITSRDEYRENIRLVQRTRLAVDNGEFKPGIICFAAPVLNNRNEAQFSIGISGPSDLITPSYEEFGNLVREAGIEASMLLGNAGK